MTLEQPKKAINPYAATNSVGGSNAFVGRTDILQAVQKILKDSQQQAITLFGQRRIGKTSILRQLEVNLPNQGNYRLVFFDLLGKAFQPLEVTLQDLANKISDALSEANPKLTNFADFHQHWLPRVLKAKESSCLVLLLDEFDALEDAASKKASENFFYYLRDHLLTLHPRLKFVFAIGRNIGDLTGVAMSLFKGIHAEQVSLLPYQDTVQLIRFSENNQTLTWSKEAIETIWQLTSGHPYLTQMLCWQTWEALLMGEQLATPIPQVTAEDVKQRVAKTLKASDNALQWLWKGLPPSEKIVTSVIASANRPIQEQELATLLQQKGVRITEQLPTILFSLEQWDLIDKRAGDNYGVRVELIRQWVAENEPLAQIQVEIDRVHPQADAVYKSALAFYQGEDYENALNDVKRALKLNSNHLQANQLLAEILIKRNELEEARQHLENFYQYQPSSARGQLLHVLSILAKQSNGVEQQLSYYNRVLEIDPEHDDANQSLVKILIQQNRLEEARQHLEKLYQSQPGRVRDQLCEVLLKIAQASDEAQQLSSYSRILEIDSENDIAKSWLQKCWEQRGDEAYQQNDLEKAKEYYAKAGQLDKVAEIELQQKKQVLLQQQVEPLLDIILKREEIIAVVFLYDLTTGKILCHKNKPGTKDFTQFNSVTVEALRELKNIPMAVLKASQQIGQLECAIFKLTKGMFLVFFLEIKSPIVVVFISTTSEIGYFKRSGEKSIKDLKAKLEEINKLLPT